MTGRSCIRVAAFAACCALYGAGAAPSLASPPARTPGATALVAVQGSAVPATSVSRPVGTLAAGRAVQAVIAFKPRNAFRLHRLARRASGRPGLGEARIRSLFAPDPGHVRSVRAYLAAHGLTVTAHTDMTLTVAGTATAAEHAFGVGLRVFQSPAGATFHAPAGAIRLPAQIAGAVQAVGGLDTSVRLRPASGRPKLHRLAAAITPTCAGATSAQQTLGGYLPADLGGSQAYGQNNLIAGGADGSGTTTSAAAFPASPARTRPTRSWAGRTRT